MKIVIALLMAVLASVSGFAQEERPANPVRILTAGQHITPYKIEVTFGKTVHILFPTEVRYVDLGSNNIIAGKADGVENVVRVKAAVKEFPGETNFSVITGDGSFFSFNVVYKEEPSTLNINMDEAYDIGTGFSKQAVEEHGRGAVFLAHILRVIEAARRNGAGKIQLWGDILQKYPDLKGIMGTSSFDAPGVARAIEELGLQG